MTTFDTTGWLAALVDHLSQHPELNKSLSTAHGYDARILVGGSLDDHLTHFAAWLRTMGATWKAKVTCVADGNQQPYTHLEATGFIGGIEATVVVCLGDRDTDLLVANTRVEVGDYIRVDLLLRLTNHADAEHRDVRYFRTNTGASWRVRPNGHVQHWIGDGWIDSVTSLDELTNRPDIAEVPDELVTP